MRKVYIEVKVKLVVNMDEGVEVGEVVDEVFPRLEGGDDKFDITYIEVLDYEVTDSK
jgi:hypothetical protein